jgi:hypothetical protein
MMPPLANAAAKLPRKVSQPPLQLLLNIRASLRGMKALSSQPARSPSVGLAGCGTGQQARPAEQASDTRQPPRVSRVVVFDRVLTLPEEWGTKGSR